MTINEMIQKREKVWETAKNFVDTHENGNGVLSAEDNAAYERMEQEIEDLTAAIDRRQRAAAREAQLSQPVNTPLTGRQAGRMRRPGGRPTHIGGKLVIEEGAEVEGKTNEESREVQTETLTIKATPLSNGMVKAKTGDETDEDTYNNWYTKVYVPGASEAVALKAKGAAVAKVPASAKAEP